MSAAPATRSNEAYPRVFGCSARACKANRPFAYSSPVCDVVKEGTTAVELAMVANAAQKFLDSKGIDSTIQGNPRKDGISIGYQTFGTPALIMTGWSPPRQADALNLSSIMIAAGVDARRATEVQAPAPTSKPRLYDLKP